MLALQMEILTRKCLLNQDLKDYWGVSVHGLFIELATLIARTSTHSWRRILHGKGDEHYHHWKRVTICSRNITKLAKLQFCECSTQVEQMRVVNCKYLMRVDVRGMKGLHSIELIGCDSLEQVCIDMEGCLVKTFPKYERFGILAGLLSGCQFSIPCIFQQLVIHQIYMTAHLYSACKLVGIQNCFPILVVQKTRGQCPDIIGRR